MQTKNRHIYKRDGFNLTFVTTVLARSPEEAIQRMTDQLPGKYVVIDTQFEEIANVSAVLRATVQP